MNTLKRLHYFRLLAVTLVVVLSLGVASTTRATAGVIWEHEMVGLSGSHTTQPPPDVIQAWIGTLDLANTASHRLFRNVDLTAASVGELHVATSESDPEFDIAVQQLTDGMVNWFLYGSTASGTQAGHETAFFQDVPGATGVDLIGFQIDRFTMTLLEYSYDIPGDDPNGDGIWRTTTTRAHFTIEGFLVPEPSSLALINLGVGIAAIGGIVRRLRRRPSSGP